MSKTAVINFNTDDLTQQVQVWLQIWTDESSLTRQKTGALPPNNNLFAFYSLWRNAYVHLKPHSSRSSKMSVGYQPGQITNVSVRYHGAEVCRQLYQALVKEMQKWLKSPQLSWQDIREILIDELKESQVKGEEIRLIIQAPDKLWKLPWQEFDLLQKYQDVEVGISLSEFKKTEQEIQPKQKVPILVVLGDSTGINVQKDLETIEELGEVAIEPELLIQPEPKELIGNLRRQEARIFLFSGHSGTHGETGRIYITEDKSLEIEDFKKALIEAIRQGLQIALFNSCDGLGLAKQVANLEIPIVIVWREPVQDLVAQEFLKEFLKRYSQGESLYTAVRRARESLEGFEQEFPGSTVLPVVFQNPAVKPPSWEDLLEQSNNEDFIRIITNDR